MPRKKQNETIGRKRKKPLTSKPKSKKRKLNNNDSDDNDEDINMLKILKGKQICITGSFKLQQKEMIKLITDNGGTKNATCGKKAFCLLMKNNTHSTQCKSNKCTKAKQNGVPIIREQWLYDSIQQKELLHFDEKDKNNREYIIFFKEKRKLPKYPKKIDINNHHKKIENDKILKNYLCPPPIKTRDLAMILYFRALDRYPGGNADMYIIKFILLINGNNVRLEKINRTNWDGMNYISKKPFEIKVDDELNHVDRICNAFVALYNANDNKQDFYFEVIDKRMDSEESDTEWTHLEWRVYIPPKYGDDNKKKTLNRRYKSDECEIWSTFANSKKRVIIDIVDDYIGNYDIEKNWFQILSFKRNAIYRAGGYGGPLPTTEHKETKQAEMLIECVSNLCGIERPQNETAVLCGKSRSAKDNEKDKEVEIDYGKKGCYDMPSVLIKGFDY